MKRLLDCRNGTALIEFALVFPIVLLLLVGTVEMSRYAIIQMKLDKAANALSDFVTQGDQVNRTNLNGFAATMPQIMKPFGFSGSVIFSDIATLGGNASICSGNKTNCVMWQYVALGSDSSQLGAPATRVSLPDGYQIKNGQDMIATEIYYNYAPLLPITGTLISSLSAHKIYKLALTKPRLGLLTTLD